MPTGEEGLSKVAVVSLIGLGFFLTLLLLVCCLSLKHLLKLVRHALAVMYLGVKVAFGNHRNLGQLFADHFELRYVIAFELTLGDPELALFNHELLSSVLYRPVALYHLDLLFDVLDRLLLLLAHGPSLTTEVSLRHLVAGVESIFRPIENL